MNVIRVPLEHKMFQQEISGSLDNFIYDNFAFMYTYGNKIALGLSVFFEPEVNGTELYLVRLGEEWISDVCYVVKLDDESNNGFSVYCNSCEDKYIEIGYEIAEIALRTMVYIMNTPRTRIDKMKIPSSNNINPNNKKKARKDSIFLLDEIVDYVNENGLTTSTNGTHKITCPCWSVRGHYRHYKNGKVVFVDNYKKGREKERMEPKDKIYRI